MVANMPLQELMVWFRANLLPYIIDKSQRLKSARIFAMPVIRL